MFCNDIKQNRYEATVIVSDEAIWNYHNKKWTNVTSNTSIQNLNWNKYKIYLDNIEFGNYYLWKDDRWYAFDDHKNAISLEGDLLAYRSNFDLKIYDFVEDEIKDKTYVEKVLLENNLSTNSQFTSSSKISFDFDNDGFIEDFYLISNVFPHDFVPDTIFSIVFIFIGI